MEQNIKESILNNSDTDVLLVKEPNVDEVRVVSSIGKDGGLKTLPADRLNESEFLKIDRHGNMLENFFSNFMRQAKDPSHFNFFRVQLEDVETSAQSINNVFKGGTDMDDEVVARNTAIDPQDYAKEQKNGYKQLSDMRLTFAVDDIDEGDTVMIAGIANATIPQGVTDLDELVMYAYNGEITEYNGVFSSMCSGSLRKGGFEIIGECDDVLIGDDDFTNIEVLFAPIVSKVAMQLTVADDFGDYYPGDIRVERVTANNIYLQIPFFGDEEYCVIAQDPNIEGENYQNLFYLYPYSTPLFVVDATYDLDGDFATTDDQTPMSYNIRLTGEYGNEESIVMSSYYRIKGTIVGLAGASVVLQLTVSDWAEVRDFDFTL